MYFHLKMYKHANIANMTATLERAVAVLDQDFAAGTGTEAKTLIRFVSIVFFLLVLQTISVRGTFFYWIQLRYCCQNDLL